MHQLVKIWIKLDYFSFAMRVLNHFDEAYDQLEALATHPKLMPFHSNFATAKSKIYYTFHCLPVEAPQSSISEKAFSNLIELLIIYLDDFESDELIRILAKLGEFAPQNRSFPNNLIDKMLSRIVLSPLSYNNLRDIFLAIHSLFQSSQAFTLNYTHMNKLFAQLTKDPDTNSAIYLPADTITILEAIVTIHQQIGYIPNKQSIDNMVRALAGWGPQSKISAKELESRFIPILKQKEISDCEYKKLIDEAILSLIRFISAPDVEYYRTTVFNSLANLYPTDKRFIQQSLYSKTGSPPPISCTNPFIPQIISNLNDFNQSTNKVAILESLGRIFKSLGGSYAKGALKLFSAALNYEIPDCESVIETFFSLQRKIVLCTDKTAAKKDLLTLLIYNLQHLKHHIPTLSIAIDLTSEAYRKSLPTKPIDRFDSNLDEQNWLFVTLINEFIALSDHYSHKNSAALSQSHLQIAILVKNLNPYFAQFSEPHWGYALEEAQTNTTNPHSSKELVDNFTNAQIDFIQNNNHNQNRVCFESCNLVFNLDSIFSKELWRIILKAYDLPYQKAIAFLKDNLNNTELNTFDKHLLSLIKSFIWLSHNYHDYKKSALKLVQISKILEQMGGVFLSSSLIFLGMALELYGIYLHSTEVEKDLLIAPDLSKVSTKKLLDALIESNTDIFSEEVIYVINLCTNESVLDKLTLIEKAIQQKWDSEIDLSLLKLARASYIITYSKARNDFKEAGYCFISMSLIADQLNLSTISVACVKAGRDHLFLSYIQSLENLLIEFANNGIAFIEENQTNPNTQKMLISSMNSLRYHQGCLSTNQILFRNLISRLDKCAILFNKGLFKLLADELVIVGQSYSELGQAFIKPSKIFYAAALKYYKLHLQQKAQSLPIPLNIAQAIPAYSLREVMKAQLAFMRNSNREAKAAVVHTLMVLPYIESLDEEIQMLRAIYKKPFDKLLPEIEKARKQLPNANLLELAEHTVKLTLIEKGDFKFILELIKLRLLIEKKPPILAMEADLYLEYQVNLLEKELSPARPLNLASHSFYYRPKSTEGKGEAPENLTP